MTNAAKYVSDKFDGGGGEGELGENGRGRGSREREEGMGGVGRGGREMRREGCFSISLEPSLVGGWHQHVLHFE